MRLVTALVAADLRRSWRGLLGVALVVGIGSSAVMLALAGARRADSAFARFRSSVSDGHVLVGIDEAPNRLEELHHLPTVDVVAPFGYVPIVPRGAPDDASVEGGGFASLDGRWLYDVQRPRVLEGAMPRPDATDQMVVNETFAEQFGVSPGDVLTMQAATARAMDGSADRDEVTTHDLEVTAVVRTPLDISANVGGPVVYLPPGFLGAHPDVGVVRGYGLVRLVDGDASFPEFARQAAARFDGERSFTTSLITLEGRTVERAIDVQVTALLIVAVVAAASATALLMQVSERRIRRAADATAALHAIGASRPQRIAILTGPPLVAAAGGALAAGGVSFVLSSQLPRGLARLADPDPGRYLDGPAILGVTLATVLVAGCLLTVAAIRATAGGVRTLRPAGPAGRALTWMQSSGARLPAVTGLRFVWPERGVPRRTFTLTPFVGLVVGIGGLIGTSAFGLRLGDVVVDDAAWGVSFDLDARIDDPARAVRTAADVSAIPGVTGVTEVRYAEVMDLGGVSTPAFGLRAREGDLAVTVVAGSAPRAEGDALLGVRTADALGVAIGDPLPVPGARGSSVDLRVVGLGLVPIVGDGTYDRALVVLEPTFDLLRTDDPEASLWVSVGEGANEEAISSAIGSSGAVGPTEPPSEQRNLRSAQAYPGVVGVLVGALALAGLANALLAGTSARRRDLAILRTIGFTGRQVRVVVLWQSIAIATIGLALAVPAGVVAAEAAWRALADSLSLDRSLGHPWLPTALVAAGLVALAIAAAIPTGRTCARRSPLDDLRGE